MKLNHFIGGVLLVAGTTIGAGMLAIPVSSGFMGFAPSISLFILCWLFFLVTAILLIDVNDSIKVESNLITMAGKTLGAAGKAFTWVVYLLLLYSLTAAYIAGSAPLFQDFIQAITGLDVPVHVCYFALPVIFGFFVYLGTTGVDLINRLFMFALILSYVILVAFVPSHIDFNLLKHFDFESSVIGLPIIITSFGYHIIIPTLGTYLNHDRKHLLLTVIFGSLITFIVIALWQFLVLGVVPLEGKISLANTWFIEGGSSATPLAKILKTPLISVTAHFFSFFAIVTSFLGVSLSLADFVTDGFRLKKSWEGRLIACLLTFVPPVLFVFTYQRGFVLALEYAGAFVALLLGLLPAAMAWKLKSRFYQSFEGKALLIFIGLVSIAIVVVDILIQQGTFTHLLDRYRG